ncbi:MAG: hypothetical protein HY074_12515 [Deltaproteobacteria bacterium]|nr:hypothetical protein [Deltaproteobacteria bacterium]
MKGHRHHPSLVLLLLAFLAGVQAWGHGADKPVKAVSGVSGIFGDSHGGYGFVSSSEAAASDSLNFGCSPEDIKSYVKAACKPGTGIADPNTLARDFLLPIVTQKMRDKIYESMVLRQEAARASADRLLALRPGTDEAVRNAAGAKADVRPIPVAASPGCISPDSSGMHAAKDLPVAYPGAETGTGDTIITRYPGDTDMILADRGSEMTEGSLLQRYRATINQFNIQTMLQSVAFSDQLDYELTKCTGAASSSPLCADLHDKKERLAGSFPMLFGPGSEARAEKMRAAYKSVVGDGAYKRAIQRDVKKDRNNSLGALDEDFAKALVKGIKPDAKPADVAVDQKVMDAALSVMNDQEAASAQEMSAVCGTPGSSPSLEDLVKRYPNVAKQMLLDMPESSRQAAKAVLCSSPALAQLHNPPRCDGVCGSLANGGEMKVCRAQPDFPYSSDSFFKYRRPDPSGPLMMDLTVYLSPGPGMKKEDVEAAAAEMQANAQSYYNCQAGNTPPATFKFKDKPTATVEQEVSCPPDVKDKPNPPIQFNISMKIAPDKKAQPLVQYNKCYRAEDSITDCDKVRGFVVKDCQKACEGQADCKKACDSSEPAVACKTKCNEKFEIDLDEDATKAAKTDAKRTACSENCDRHVAAAGSPELNREDAGHYTANTGLGTVFHEVGHLLSLDDEYQNPAYSFNLLGEHDSLMNNSSGKSRIYPRHFRRMETPALSCAGIRACDADKGCSGYPK